MPAQLYVCNGCCCGRNAKEQPGEVPIEALKEAWQEHQLSDAVKTQHQHMLGPVQPGQRDDAPSTKRVVLGPW